MKAEMLQRIHDDGHQGVTKCRRRANDCIWWPGMSGDINDYVSKCDHCLKYRPAQKREPLIPTILPSRPWERIAADIFGFDKKHHRVMVDYYSRFNEHIYLPSLTSKMLNVCF